MVKYTPPILIVLIIIKTVSLMNVACLRVCKVRADSVIFLYLLPISQVTWRQTNLIPTSLSENVTLCHIFNDFPPPFLWWRHFRIAPYSLAEKTLFLTLSLKKYQKSNWKNYQSCRFSKKWKEQFFPYQKSIIFVFVICA